MSKAIPLCLQNCDDMKPYMGHISIFSANVIWALNVSIAKIALDDPQISPFAMTLIRSFGATLLFWLVSFFLPYERVNRRDLWMLFVASCLGVTFNQFTFLFGLNYTAPIDASIVCSTTPILTMIAAALFLKEPISWKKAGGIVLGAAGALVLILGNSNDGLKMGSLWGNIIILVGQMSYVFYLTLFKDVIQRYSVFTLMKWMFLFSSMIYIPFSFNTLSSIDFSSLSQSVWLSVLYVMFFSTFVGYILIPIAQKTLRPTVISIYSYLQPGIAAIFSVIIGMDTFGWHKALAIVLVFMGVYFVTVSKSRAQIDAEQLKKLHTQLTKK